MTTDDGFELRRHPIHKGRTRRQHSGVLAVNSHRFSSTSFRQISTIPQRPVARLNSTEQHRHARTLISYVKE